MMTSAEQKLAQTILRLIAKQGWNALSLEAVAKANKTNVVTLKKHFADKAEIIAFLVMYITDATVRSVGKIDVNQPPRDRLFELMMARFDVLQQNRAAIVAIVSAMKNDSRAATALLFAQREAIRTMLSRAGLDDNGIRQHINVAGLMAVYVAVAWVWQRDETIDMSRTMAALDRYLSYAGRAAEILFRLYRSDK